MKKKSAEDYLDKLLNSVNGEKLKKEKFKETAKLVEDAMTFWDSNTTVAELDGEEDELAEEEITKLSEKREHKKTENKKSDSEDVLDELLSNAKTMEMDISKQRQEAKTMYSRRVSKSEADFLREFEKELAAEEGSIDDLFAEFDQEAEFDRKSEDVDAIVQKDSYTLEDVDLNALVNEVADVMSTSTEVAAQEVIEPIPAEESWLETTPFEEEETGEMQAALKAFAMATEPIPMDEIPEDLMDDLFSGEAGLDFADMPTEMQSEEDGLDLGNLGEEDLMNLLAGTDGLEDIGNMLSNGEITEISQEELDAFSIFAENEMAAQQSAEAPVAAEEKGKKKGGFLGKIKGFFEILLRDEEEELNLKSAQSPTVEVLTSENADILAELDALEEKPSKKDNQKKEKKSKEKKKKEKKPKAPKKPKEPKPKKEKKPKEVDNTPPLPKKPVIMIWVMAASMVALVLIGVDMISYNTPIANAKSLQNKGHYAEAFAELSGLTIKEKDIEMYSQLAVLSTVDSEINAYEIFTKAEVEDKAFDSLICAAGRCYINEENADVYGCLGQLEVLKKSVSNELEQKYNMTYEEAIKMYTIRDRDDYTIALYKKLTELGIKWE